MQYGSLACVCYLFKKEGEEEASSETEKALDFQDSELTTFSSHQSQMIGVRYFMRQNILFVVVVSIFIVFGMYVCLLPAAKRERMHSSFVVIT